MGILLTATAFYLFKKYKSNAKIDVYQDIDISSKSSSLWAHLEYLMSLKPKILIMNRLEIESIDKTN